MNIVKTFMQRWKRRRALRKFSNGMDNDIAALERAVESCFEMLSVVNDELKQAKERMKDYESQNRLLDEENDKLRAELQIAKDITIPALTEAHALILKRVEADINVQVRRAAVGAP